MSALFALWSLTGFVLEVPSGALADATSRRALLVVAQLLTAAAFAVWVLAPSFAAFALGFALWGVAGALQSGALEALAYEELGHAGAAERYAEVMGRATGLGTLSATLAIGLAAPALALGGFALVGAVSVAACLGAAAVAATLPEHRERRARGGGERAKWVRPAVAEVRARPAVRAAVLLVAAVAAVWGSLEEYTPLLAAGTGVGDAAVPLLVLVVCLGVSAGGALGGRAARLTNAGVAVLLAGGAVALAAGALTKEPAGFALVAAAFAAFQAATIAADARLQHAIAGDARATVTSLASLATEAVVLAVFAAYAAGSAVASHATLFAVLAAPYLVVAGLLARPARRARAAER